LPQPAFASGRSVYVKDIDSAQETLAVCLREQLTKPPEQREKVTIGYATMSKQEWDEMDDVPDGEC